MTPLVILIAFFTVTYLFNKFFNKSLSLSFIGRLSMAVMLVFTGIAHFTNTEEMVQMLPDFMPLKKEVIYVSGILEIAAFIGMLSPGLSKLTSILLIVFFLCILPANIIGSIKQISIGGMQYGISYLLFRIPLQLFFIAWVYYFGIKINKSL